MTPPVRPLGFTLLGIYLGLQAIGGFVEALSYDYDVPLPMGVEALPLVGAIFAGVAAEALWRCRPWCVRAFVANCCVRLLQSLVAVIGIGAIEASEPLITLAMNAFIAAIVGGYVYNRAVRLFAPPSPRVPIPAPRP